MTPTLLVLAKAPVEGQVKTRLGADVGMRASADLAAAALLDTLDLCREAYPDAAGVVAMAGDLSEAERGEELRDVLTAWRVEEQVGATFGERIAHAHGLVDGPVLQIGMDTPHLHPTLLSEAGDSLAAHEAVLGLAEDGGWWVLGLADPARAALISEVPTSNDDTGARTLEALAREIDVVTTSTSYDVDTVAEAERSAHDAPQTRFAAAWRELNDPARHP
ncbi:hypothetical protein GCM10011519_00170 [Marmoricola endophyticus]|uniref:DUF2064 domain-containing protein n=1 Tax=Marmoricola endophyticus TaxID=2040280 RepID=A0A917EXD2_9ACTN|nr:DUF2064 domain-containing protein [Marmoricola endophyticus]GGF30708.1 hypothetical protein GCM10011519_00170 [Marmoricola endophyticus]